MSGDLWEQRLARARAWWDRALADDPAGSRIPPGPVALVLLAPLVLALIHATAPLVVVNNAHNDLFVPLDTGWRVWWGQRPHVDFHTPVGALYAYAYGGAMAVLGPSARVILAVPAAATAVLVGLGWALARTRLPTVIAAPFAAWVGLLALSPVQLDTGHVAHLAWYNRLSWALVAVSGLGALLPSRAVRTTGIVVGAALLALFFVKITLFLLAVGLVGLGVVAVPTQRRALVGALGAVAIVVAGLAVGTELVPAYLADIGHAIASADPARELENAAAGQPRGLAKVALQLGANVVGLVAIAASVLWLSQTARDADRADTDRAALLAMLATLATTGAAIQNHDLACPPLVIALLVVVAASARQARRGVFAELWALVAVGWLLLAGGRDAVGVLTHRLLPDDDAFRIAGPTSPGADVRFAGFDPAAPPPDEPASRIRAGVEALAGLPETDRVLSLTFAQPFAFLTGRPPPPGLLVWYDPGRTFGPGSPLTADMLRDVDVVLVPRELEPMIGGRLWAAWGAAIEQEFTPTETPRWTLWRR